MFTFQKNKYRKNQKGNTLVISIVFMLVMTAITLALSEAFMSELDLSENLDNAILAYYGAESGIEYGLYDARKTDLTLASSISSGTFDNGVTWSRITNDTVNTVSLDQIDKNSSIQLDFYDPDNPAQASGVASIKIDWNGAVGSWILLKITSWTPGASIDWSTKNDVEYLQANSPSAMIINLNSSLAYKFKITALQANVQNFTFTAYDAADATGNIVPIPNFLDITGKGQYAEANQAINVYMPRSLQLSSLYNYVIFTEDSLVKEFN